MIVEAVEEILTAENLATHVGELDIFQEIAVKDEVVVMDGVVVTAVVSDVVEVVIMPGNVKLRRRLVIIVVKLAISKQTVLTLSNQRKKINVTSVTKLVILPAIVKMKKMPKESPMYPAIDVESGVILHAIVKTKQILEHVTTVKNLAIKQEIVTSQKRVKPVTSVTKLVTLLGNALQKNEGSSVTYNDWCSQANALQRHA